MGTSKTQEFNREHNAIARYAKAMAHPARVAILDYLLQRKECICGDIVDQLPLSQSTVSQHLQELKEAGLIKGDIAGKTVCYCIDHEHWDKARKALSGFLDKATVMKYCC